MADLQIPAPGVKAAPLTYLVPGSVELILKAAFATFDGSGAGGAFLPCLRVLSPAGLVVGEYVTDASVAAGSSAEVSFAPFLRSAGGSSTPTTPPEWCAFHSGSTTNPFAFNFFTSSNTAVFSTATAGAPTVVSNTTGDKYLMLRANGTYLVMGWAQLTTTVAAADRWLDFGNYGNAWAPIIFEAAKAWGWLDTHGLAVQNFAANNFLAGTGAWVGNTGMLRVDSAQSGGVKYIGFGFGTGGVLSANNFYGACYYWPSGGGTNLY